MSEPTIAEQLRALIAQEALTDKLTAALEKVANLEHEHTATVEQARFERAFLERAPREGLLYPGDALKLGDVLTRLREARDFEQKLTEIFQGLRSKRPYLFGGGASPANQKLSQADHEAPPNQLRHGSLTRQVQELRRRKR